MMNQRTLLAVCLAACLGLTGLMTGCTSSHPDGVPNSQPSAMRQPSPRDDFERSADIPINADTHFAAGRLAEAQDAPARAMDQYQEALKLNPKHTDTLFRLGILYTRVRQFSDAIGIWNRYIAATGGDATGYANLGFTLELAGRTAEAETAYRNGIAKDSANGPCRVNYGLLLARHGRFGEATLQMQAVLSEAEVHYNFAGVYETQGRKEQAKVEYRKALDADPKMQEAQARLDLLD